GPGRGAGLGKALLPGSSDVMRIVTNPPATFRAVMSRAPAARGGSLTLIDRSQQYSSGWAGAAGHRPRRLASQRPWRGGAPPRTGPIDRSSPAWANGPQRGQRFDSTVAPAIWWRRAGR